jgi:uncharacterized protein (UPF0332 family)
MKAESRRFLDKAARAIRAAETLLREGNPDFSAGRTYYAMFYAAEALLTERGMIFRKHGGVHGAFGEEYVKTGLFDAKFHRWLLDAFDRRIQADYGIDAAISREDAARVIEQAREFLRAVEAHLGSQG